MYSDETVKEGAKAVQEVAKTTATIAELAGKAGAFLSRVIGRPTEQVGGILEDQIRFYRFKNLCAVADKVDAIYHQRKIQGKTIQIPMRVAIPMLESAALEDDDTLQNIWAKLIANSTDPHFNQPLHPAFIHLVKELSSDEALILIACSRRPTNSFYLVEGQHPNTAILTHTNFANKLCSVFIEDDEVNTIKLKNSAAIDIYIDNLQRLGLFDNHEEPFIENKILRILYEPTNFGVDFISTCINDNV